MATQKVKPSAEKSKANVVFGFSKNYLLSGLIIFLLSFLLYANTLTHQYALDDAIVITENQFTQEGMDGLGGILTKDTFFGFFKEEGKAQLVSGGRYRPLSLVMFVLERGAFGKTPYVGHFFNVLWYSLTNVLLFFVLLLMLRDRWKETAGLLAFLAAVIFAAHPIHTEVVANIKGRDEILALFFSLAALYCYIKAIDKQKNFYLILIIPIFFLALMAKENSITFLAILPLSAWIFRKKWSFNPVLSVLSMAIPVISFLLIRWNVIGSLGADGVPMELMNNPFLKLEGGRYVLMSFSEKMATIVYTWGMYIKLLIFPHPLTHDYYPRHIDIMSWTNPAVLISAVLYIGGAIWALKNINKSNIPAYSVLFFLVTFSIVSNLLFPVGTNMSERFVFMPSVGFALVLSWLLYKLLHVGKMYFYLATAILLILYSYKTVDRNKVWYDNASLFIYDAEISKRSAKLQNAVGGEKIKIATENREVFDVDLLNQAIVHLNRATEIHPTYKNAYLLLGNANLYLKNFEVGIANYEKSLKLDPNYREGLSNLQIAYRRAGQYYGEERGDINQALIYLKRAYEMNPNDYDTNRLLGVATGISGNPQQALAYFLRAVELDPENAGAWLNLGSAYGVLGNIEEANRAHAKAVALDPNVMKNIQGGQ